jgi:hypothetical protein
VSPLIVQNRTNLPVCSVSRAGIGMVQAVVEQASWNIDDRIEVGFIEKAKCILLRKTHGNDGFKLAYSNANKKTGGRIGCNAWVRNYLQTVVELPKKNLIPVFTKGADWTIALLLEDFDWIQEEFSKLGVNTVPKDTAGIYELLGKGDAVLRVGEGIIKDRINAHLKDSRFAPPTVKSFRYIALSDPIDGKILERVLIAKYENEVGVLPRFQEIRA